VKAAAALLGLAALLLAGCVSTAVAVVKAPFQVAGWTVDKLTTSQSESDRNRGRRERKAEDAERKAAKKAAREHDRR